MLLQPIAQVVSVGAVGEYFVLMLDRLSSMTSQSMFLDEALVRQLRQSRIDAGRQMTRASAWSKNVRSAKASRSLKAVAETVKSIQQDIARFGPESVDFRWVTLSGSVPEHIVAVLRATFPWRDAISGWKEFLMESQARLHQLGYDSAAVLKGLDR